MSERQGGGLQGGLGRVLGSGSWWGRLRQEQAEEGAAGRGAL